MPLRLIDTKNSRMPAACGLCSSDPRFTQLVNESVQMLLPKGHWWGTCNRYKICATDGCITLPSKIATADLSSVCGEAVPTRDFWYELLENGIGVRSVNCGTNEAIMRGVFPVFSDIRGSTPKKLIFQCDLLVDVGKHVLVLGLDNNNNWIRTMQNGIMADGEVILLAQSPGTTSVNNFSKITAIQFLDTMSGQSWLYELNTSTNAIRQIGHYDYWDVLPAFQRYLYTGIPCNPSVPILVEIVGKLAFIPAVNDNDFLMIGNLPAIKFMGQAIVKSDREDDMTKKEAIIASGYKLAANELNAELDHYLGSGRRIGIVVEGSGHYAFSEIEALI